MSNETSRPQDTADSGKTAVHALYRQMLDGWNSREAAACAAPFAETSEIIGFDGSQHTGRAGFAADLRRIFADHVTPAYVAKVRSVRLLTPDVAVLNAVVGMVPSGQTDLNPQLNAVQSVVAARHDEQWRIELFQTTPAQYHGRPELAQQLTDELRKLL